MNKYAIFLNDNNYIPLIIRQKQRLNYLKLDIELTVFLINNIVLTDKERQLLFENNILINDIINFNSKYKIFQQGEISINQKESLIFKDIIIFQLISTECLRYIFYNMSQNEFNNVIDKEYKKIKIMINDFSKLLDSLKLLEE